MVNWDVFAGLPGASTTNFEMLCRAIIRRHYGSFGEFVALANQPGVEFHLKLHSSCSLSVVGRWYGWQCRWYELPSGRAIGATRRRKIVEAIATTEAELPDLTDWVLWTRYPLTAGDQAWFRSLATHMRLHLWTAAEVEEHLSGSAEILRGTYFGELILTPDLLEERHKAAVTRIKRRWQPDVHQVMDAERAIRRQLGEVDAWAQLMALASRVAADSTELADNATGLPTDLADRVSSFIEAARALSTSMDEIHIALNSGDYEILRQQIKGRAVPGHEWDDLLRRLRSGRHLAALAATNLLADMHGVYKVLCALFNALSGYLVAVIADAGYGKTELAAQLTAPSNGRPAGILLHGGDLYAGHTLDDLSRGLTIQGRPVPSFESLVAAVDAAGQRTGRRLPIVIDGLNEAEDPRVWKDQLASCGATLEKYPNVLVVCTLRSPFADETLPDEMFRLEMQGFEDDTVEAVRRYFRYYKIDPADADLPWGLLRHPLTLRMFCEVTNPDRSRTVGVEAMPNSLTALFDRYLEQVAERITQLAPRSWRYFEADVHTALIEVGLALWEEDARSLDIVGLRRRLGDEGRPWDKSIVRALEHDGVLLRGPGDWHTTGHVGVLHDALAGHLVAEALLGKYGGRGFEEWLREAGTILALSGGVNECHPLAADIFRALVGLTPVRMNRRQFWQVLGEPMKTAALYEAAWLEGAYLDRETVSLLATVVVEVPATGRRDLFDCLWSTRAARNHPLDAGFLDEVLRSMSVANRDLRWTEWVRRNQEQIVDDIKRLELRWRSRHLQVPADRMRAQWIMWTLTSTVRSLRDHATRALYWIGCAEPAVLFELTLNALEVNDPYIPERMLAACYGVAMAMWSDPRGDNVRGALPSFANELVDRMFAPGAQHPTRHILTRDYAIGVITLATLVVPGCLSTEKSRYIEPPFAHIPSPFPPVAEIDDAEVAEAHGSIGMDFGNYTIGRLIPKRGNYDFKNPTYVEVRRQIEHRIAALGYSRSRFSTIDDAIAGGSYRAESRGAPKTDRYGKKYAWIAYFEMYGLRFDELKLAEWRAGERASDADIDPSFPEPARNWTPTLPDLFTGAPVKPQKWIADGPIPNYDHLLHCDEIDGQTGPWLLLNGYIQQSDKDDVRRVFSFLRGLLVSHDHLGKILAAFDSIEYPGNDAIPEPGHDAYMYAGEIPWSPRFGSSLRSPDSRAIRDVREAFVVHDGQRWLPGFPVEVPAYEFAWESYHSALNQVSGITVPAPALCEHLHLTSRQGEWDLYDADGQAASLYRELKTDDDGIRSDLLYLREDLLAAYLAETGQVIVWFIWGERDLDYRVSERQTRALQDIWASHRHIHRRRLHWEPGT